jgi:regulator of sigma E protease
MLTVVAFIVALGLLIAVHEYGHYRVAVACGVKVLRFSVGFGKTSVRWQPKTPGLGQTTEFVIGAFPLGGYVRCWTSARRRWPTPSGTWPSTRSRCAGARAIVAAGPLPTCCWRCCCMRWSTGWRPGAPRRCWPARWPARLRRGRAARRRAVRAPALGRRRWSRCASFDDLRWLLTRALWMAVTSGWRWREARRRRRGDLPLSRLEARDADAALFRRIGIWGPMDAARGGRDHAGRRRRARRLAQGRCGAARWRCRWWTAQQLRELIRGSGAGGQAGAASGASSARAG